MRALRPSTSSPALHQLCVSLGLSVELEPSGCVDLPALMRQLFDWYSDRARAAPARVFALREGEEPPRDVLTLWACSPLPRNARGDELISYAADVLLIAARHGGVPSTPQLLRMKSGPLALYLLRPRAPQPLLVEGEGWLPATLHSRDTEAALAGEFRDHGCTPAFAEHAGDCRRCEAALESWDFKFGLPAGFERFRYALEQQPLGGPMDEGVIEEGVAICIPRSSEPPRPPRVWWKFWE